MKNNISIRTMIISISVVLLAVILGQGVYTFLGSNSIKHGSGDIQEKSRNIEEHILPASTFTQKFLSTFEKMDTKKQQVVDLSLNDVEGIEDLADGTLSDFESLSGEAKGLLDSIQRYHKSVYVDTLRQRFDAFSTATQGILETLADGEKPSSEEISSAVESTKGISGLVDKIAKNNQKETGDNFKIVKETAAKNSSLASQFNWMAIVIFVILMSVVFYFLYYITGLVHSIRKLAADSNEIRKGDLNHKVVQERGDEMGELQGSFDNMRLEVKDFIENLDRKVQERTREVVEEKKKVSALLNNMKQAVIKINADLVIVPPASTYAQEVFGEDVVGKSIFETLYSGLSERSEERVQLDTAFVAVFGEGEMQWDLSCDGLVPRIVRSRNGQPQILRVGYAPLWDEDENLEEIMMVIEDITELERLAIEKKKNEERIGIIQEISMVPMNDLEDYFASSSRLFQDAQSILDKGVFDLESLGLLFRSLHTLKGNSRVFGLTLIGSAVHEVETHVGNATETVKSGEAVSSSLVHAIHDTLFVAYSRLNVYADVANHFFKLGVDLRKGILQALHSDLVLIESSLKQPDQFDLESLKTVGARIFRNCTLLDDDDIRARAERLKSSFAKSGSVQSVSEEHYALGSLLLDRFGSQLIPIGLDQKSDLVKLALSCSGLVGSQTIDRAELGLSNSLKEVWFSIYAVDQGQDKVMTSLVATEVAYCIAISFTDEQIQQISFYIEEGRDVGMWFSRPHFKTSILGSINSSSKFGVSMRSFFEELAKSVGLESVKAYFDLIAQLDVEKASFICQEAFVKNQVGLDLFKAEPATSRLIDVLVSARGSVDFYVKSFLNAVLYEAMEIYRSLYEGVEVRHSVNSNKLAQLENALIGLRDGQSQVDANQLWLIYKQLNFADVRSALNRYRVMVAELAGNLGKKVKFELVGDDVALPSEQLSLLLDSMVHLIRNSLDHGLEAVDVRESMGKNPEGRLGITLEDLPGKIRVIIEDDGKGMDPDVIYSKAKEKGLIQKEISDPNEKLQVIFLPGFSTKESVTDLSGRGVGMDVVKRNVEGGLGGTLHLESTFTKGSKFVIEIPI